MGEIINLRLARKAKSRNDAEKAAGENRLKFGRSKSERILAGRRAEQDERKLDGHKLSTDQRDE